MNATPQTTTTQAKPAPKNFLVRRLVQLGVFILVMAAILFALAGRVDWTQAWVLLGIYLGIILINGLLFLPQKTGLVEERAQAKENVKAWDKVVTSLMTVFTFLGPLAVAGLDQRFDWTGALPLWVFILGGLLYAAGYAFSSWAMQVNRFFSTYVRIQTDRGHQVVSSGPYRLVRHPGYLGMCMAAAGACLLLGSLWALLPSVIGIGLVVLRTTLEDRTLRRELPGYEEFTLKTRYRLFPGIW
jgi:protein-S-isoprenylcysteine O-methyltransferase Ste14